MSLFSDEHGPPRKPPQVGDIPVGVRQAILDWFHARGVRTAHLWNLLKQLHGYGDYEQAGQDILARYGEGAGIRFADEFKAGRARGAGTADTAHWITRGALTGVPAAMFLDVLSEAIYEYANEGALVDYFGSGDEAIKYVNELFERRGIAYRAKDDGMFEWVGDTGSAAIVVQPALDALADVRLTGAKGDFDQARGHLRKGTKKDNEQAVHESGNAVESTMKSLLDAHSVGRDEKDAAQKLWERLRDADIVPKQTEAMILGAPRIRNAFGGHGSGQQPHHVPVSLAVAAVGSSATAIVYLAAQLP